MSVLQNIFPSLSQHTPSRLGLNRLPATVVDLRLELAADVARDAVAEKHVAQHRVVALLAQEQLPPVPQAQISLTVLVDVRRLAEGARPQVAVVDAALADVEEDAYVLEAPVGFVSRYAS